MKNFALIGAAGYVAPRHMKAIHDTGNDLIASTDPHDSVGILDRHFPDCYHFTEIERFDRFLYKQKQLNQGIDYLSICSPNYLHDSHIRLGLRLGADVICEKPVVIKEHNIDSLLQMEKETGHKVNIILQLRLYPDLIKLKEQISKSNKNHRVTINYITPRGNWYNYSWKGKQELSGGLPMNIGVHLFDLMLWLFGDIVSSTLITQSNNKTIKGSLFLEKANVTWHLSTDANELPNNETGAFREIRIDDELLRFDNVFTDLHTDVYKHILSGNGFTLEDARSSIRLVNEINNQLK